MAELNQQVEEYKDTLASSIREIFGRREGYADQVARWWHSYRAGIASTTSQGLVEDISKLRITPATSTLAITFVTLAVATGLLFSKPSSSSSKSKPKKKKVTKAQKINSEIQQTLDKVEEEYVPQMDDYIANYDKLTDEKRDYNANYFQEMLLKELMKLDGLDVGSNTVLRDNRRKVIKFIQEHQSRLDNFRKSKSA